MTVIRLAWRRARPILDLHRRMLDTKALSQATQHDCQHLLSIRAFKELGVQGDDWNFSGERPRMYMVDARYSGNPVQLRFDSRSKPKGKGKDHRGFGPACIEYIGREIHFLVRNPG